MDTQAIVNIPESDYPALRAASEAAGMSLEAFLLNAGRKQAGASPEAEPSRDSPLKEYFDEFDKKPESEKQAIREAVAEVQTTIDDEFSLVSQSGL